MKLGRRRNYHKGLAAIRHYANLNEPSDSLRFKLYCSCSIGPGIETLLEISDFIGILKGEGDRAGPHITATEHWTSNIGNPS